MTCITYVMIALWIGFFIGIITVGLLKKELYDD